MSISASNLHVLARCGAMATLEHADWSGTPGTSRGSAIHSFLAAIGEVGYEAALEAVPEEYFEDCRAIDVAALPACQPDSYASEVAFAVDWQTGAARELGRNIGRRYQLEPTEVGGTCDVLGLAPDRVAIFDYKTGYVASPLAEEWQLMFYAYAAAKVYERDAADIAVIRIGTDGKPYTTIWSLTRANLDAFFERLRELMRSAILTSRQRAPGFVVGDHCRWCPAVPFCPAVTGLVRNLAVLDEGKGGEPTQMAAALVKLGPEAVSAAFDRWQAVKAGMKLIDATMKIIASQQPIALDGGKVWGPIGTTDTSYDGGVTFHVLEERCGTDVADAAVKIVTSKAAIERALKPLVRPEGVSFAAFSREIVGAIAAKGGVSQTRGEEFRRYDPAKLAAGGNGDA